MRVRVVESLIALGKEKLAFRYALCGTADQMVKGPDGVGVKPKGCGHPMCPRCGRRGAGRYVRRVQGWLGWCDHGDLFNVCFTQRAVRGESVAHARSRMAWKLRSFMRWATREGLVAGMTVHHAAVSGHPKSLGAWHYHVHALLEFPAGTFPTVESEDRGKKVQTNSLLAAQWVAIASRKGEEVSPLWHHRLLAAGPAIVALRDDTGDPDFWSESKDGVAKVIQYPMRDLAQGISAWRVGGDPVTVAERVHELVRDGRAWKMRRAWGRWRRRCPEEAAAAQLEEGGPEEEGTESAPPAAAKPLGTMRRVFLAARAGHAWAREALQGLEGNCRNNTRFARRLVAWVRAGLSRERDGP